MRNFRCFVYFVYSVLRACKQRPLLTNEQTGKLTATVANLNCLSFSAKMRFENGKYDNKIAIMLITLAFHWKFISIFCRTSVARQKVCVFVFYCFKIELFTYNCTDVIVQANFITSTNVQECVLCSLVIRNQHKRTASRTVWKSNKCKLYEAMSILSRLIDESWLPL